MGGEVLDDRDFPLPGDEELEETFDDTDASLRAGARIPDGAPRGLRSGLPRLRMAEAHEFQLGARLVRCHARGNDRPALWVVGEDGSEQRLSFAELSERSNRVANFLRALGVRRGDRVLLMLGNVVPLWEVMLASIKLGAVIIPATTLLARDDLLDRFERGGVRHVVVGAADTAKFADIAGDYTRIVVGGSGARLDQPRGRLRASAEFAPDGPTRADDPMLLYFTSGTTSKPKLVEHSHQSYPGRPPVDDVLARAEGGRRPPQHQLARLGEARLELLLRAVERRRLRVHLQLRTVQRQGGAGDRRPLRRDHAVRAADGLADVDPGGPALVPGQAARGDRRGRAAQPGNHRAGREGLGTHLRDGYGQTETTAQIGNSPGQRLKPGSMGRPLPGFRVALLDPDGNEASEGEISLRLDPRPTGLMLGYKDDPAKTAQVTAGGYYRTGDVAMRDEDGYITYVGRTDDVFKASDYRISPFELESVLIEHAAVAEAAVVPSPDPLRLAVPKAVVMLVAGHEPSAELAEDIFRFARARLAPYKRIRRLEFAELPKTISGKIRRVELRRHEDQMRKEGERGAMEFWEEDFPELKVGA